MQRRYLYRSAIQFYIREDDSKFTGFIDSAGIERNNMYICFYSKESNYYVSASEFLYNITSSANIIPRRMRNTSRITFLRCRKNKVISYFMEEKNRVSSFPFGGVPFVVHLNRRVRGTLLFSRSNIVSAPRNRDLYRLFSLPSGLLRHKVDRRKSVQRSVADDGIRVRPGMTYVRFA